MTVPVKAGYTYSIEHLLDNGAMETIIPSMDGATMTFSTHSFSPFGIAGSKSLVGPELKAIPVQRLHLQLMLHLRILHLQVLQILQKQTVQTPIRQRHLRI